MWTVGSRTPVPRLRSLIVRLTRVGVTSRPVSRPRLSTSAPRCYSSALCALASLAFDVACSAVSSVRAARVTNPVRMPSQTCFPAVSDGRPAHVLGVSHRFEMIRVAAPAISAEVIQLQAIFVLAPLENIRNTMGQKACGPDCERAVAAVVRAPCPDPARVGLVNLCPEALNLVGRLWHLDAAVLRSTLRHIGTRVVPGAL